MGRIRHIRRLAGVLAGPAPCWRSPRPRHPLWRRSCDRTRLGGSNTGRCRCTRRCRQGMSPGRYRCLALGMTS